ncbi:glutamine synthetase [Pseudomonas sp. JQ170]|uniref:glutamine synthetase n=1 Tax=unclassified Pseudomonas TaxID=196821 RepID=UPI00265715F8|nr:MULTISPECIES: glutamine synthetase [unclassified Pseudomonas]MDN7140780.1 glutamine synthetase [Pseudomonas sp. JQ170]WRO76067.1 glutamine synthetase [Pseudomonas sp. 170C]
MRLPVLSATLVLLCLSTRAEAIPLSQGLALCTRSATLLVCGDALGNYYSVQTAGSTTYLRGFEVQGRRLWTQTNSRYGQLTFYTGLASDGETWVGYSRKIGWTTLNSVSSSNGQRFNLRCNRLSGCQ